VGTDSNIILQVAGQGTGGVIVQGTGTNNNAVAGYYGELISSVISSGSPVVFTSGTRKDLTSVSLTAGDWDVYGNIYCSGTTVQQLAVWIAASSAATVDVSLQCSVIGLATASIMGLPAPFFRASLAATTTIYISGLISGTGTLNASGGIYARRAR